MGKDETKQKQQQKHKQTNNQKLKRTTHITQKPQPKTTSKQTNTLKNISERQ